jgi:hypothetical protein
MVLMAMLAIVEIIVLVFGIVFVVVMVVVVVVVAAAAVVFPVAVRAFADVFQQMREINTFIETDNTYEERTCLLRFVHNLKSQSLQDERER